MTFFESSNAVARFVLELCALAALAYWGFKTADGIILDIVLGLGAPAAFALSWGAFVAPKAPYRLDDPQRLVLEIAVFGLAALGLIAAGAVLVGVLLAIAVSANIFLMVLLDQRRQGGI
jgi:hypothetical protein